MQDAQLSDKTERTVEVLLSLIGVTVALYGLITGKFSGMESLILLTVSFGLYQSTSIVKYLKLFVGKE